MNNNENGFFDYMMFKKTSGGGGNGGDSGESGIGWFIVLCVVYFIIELFSY